MKMNGNEATAAQDERLGQAFEGRLDSELGFQLGRVHRSLREAWEQQIADLGLSAPQAALLRVVCEYPRSGIRELARRMRTDPMNAKHLADRLEEAGLLRSVADPSHRQRRELVPTDDGQALAHNVSERAAAWEGRLARLVGAYELDELRRLLARLERILGAGAERSSLGDRHLHPGPSGRR